MASEPDYMIYYIMHASKEDETDEGNMLNALFMLIPDPDMMI